MSLAYAAPYNSSDDHDKQSMAIQPPPRRNKTVRNRTSEMDTSGYTTPTPVPPTSVSSGKKVNHILNMIHQSKEEDGLEDFTLSTSSNISGSETPVQQNVYRPPVSWKQPQANTPIKGEDPIPSNKDVLYADLSSGYELSQPLKKILNSEHSNPDLMNKLNYMIHLLEEQKGEKTNNVTEELVLYVFLGVFVIFIVDSFAKVGKYVR